MKHFLLVLSFWIFYSCAARFQVIDSLPVSKLPSDTSLVLDYDFWAQGGRMMFTARNTTNKIITLHIDKCFVVFNGFSTCYYRGEIVTQGTAQSTSFAAPVNTRPLFTVGSDSKVNSNQKLLGVASSANQQFTMVSVQQLKTIQIAPFSAIQIHEFNIFDKLKVYSNESLPLSTRKKKPTSVEFSEKDSPLTITSVVTYSIEGEENGKTIQDRFFVNKISNYHKKDFPNRKAPNLYGEDLSFFIKYSPEDADLVEWQ